MSSITLVAGPDHIEGWGLRIRMGSVVAALALAFTMVVLVQHRADAAPAAAAVPAAVAGVGEITAQINVGDLIRQIVCPILLAVRNAFAGTFLASFVTPIINQLLVAFGCVISPG